ncbi:Stage V sporulation protein FA [uncultured Ruminococcus sp.]|uniref:Dipicolinate synthase subunit DpsA n=1 Tax=Massiliimalia timonensis TaxID=1987501 RepID=A0A8J6TWG9_9FIRM|nr:dipicolinate synthase subunit DpsA [Massiliimalia timonensis]MBC8609715.1 dipicolinate synthase subunit DpsA [Massiliimalia timonensis]MBS7174763.1 dipicolinate synthase subunit DpsA [Clostridiales bacterium]SCH29264.1 Stage V sporulation protein FA [uncultured Ruminococcus sp.]SCH33164.1 Stage V sporulation protein FA [uncultured Clostridium sp.]
MKHQIKKPTCVLAGGDLRQAYLANLLTEDMDVSVTAMGEDPSLFSPHVAVNSIPASHPDVLVLPMPVSNGSMLNAPLQKEPVPLAEILPLAGPNTLVFGGKVSAELEHSLSPCRVYDYLEREELAVLNAAVTAEGTLQLLLSELPVTILGLNVLIVGSGRISRALRTRLSALGAKVTVSARKHADLAWVEAEGCRPLPVASLSEEIGQFDAVINTVPAKLFDEPLLRKLSKHALLIDLASKPGGVDFEEANRLGIKTIWALSLPGKTAPITSGEIICQTIRNIMKEEQHE